VSRPLDFEKLREYAIPQATDDYDPRDAIIYALGVGAGLDPATDEAKFLYERQLQVLPTMALVLGTPGFWPMDPRCGLDWINILHGEQRLILFQPLDPAGTLLGETLVTDIADKGLGKAGLVRAVKTLKTLSGTIVAEATETWVVRGAGGFGGERELPGEALPPIPDHAPDFVMTLPTAVTQAATYRLSGDRNPLHIDSDTSKRAGLDRPILHGLSTLGLAARALIHTCCNGNATRLSSIAARFTAPVYPGETITTEIWKMPDALQFRSSATERQLVVIDHGVATMDAIAKPYVSGLKQ
jgi:acyl dehydratase